MEAYVISHSETEQIGTQACCNRNVSIARLAQRIMDTNLGNWFLRFIGFVLVATVVTGGWLWLCDTMGWNRIGWAAAILGVLLGVAIGVGNLGSRSFVAGVCAALVAGAAVGISHDRSAQQRSEKKAEELLDDKSFITAWAEQKLADQATTLVENGTASPSLSFGSPVTNSRSQIPDRIWAEAAKEWEALSESSREQIRQQRVQWMGQSHGPAPLLRDSPRLLFKAVMVVIAGALAFVLGAAPAWIARTQEALA